VKVDARLVQTWEDLRTSFWFIPGLMTLGAGLLGVGLVYLDTAVDTEAVPELRWIYTGGVEGARAVLSTIANSMIMVAGTVFSVTIVALSLASQQMGPRLLRSFIRDRGNQFVLGTFIGTFFYCLIVLGTIVGEDSGEEFIPHLSVTFGLGLAVIDVAVLIYFIHHVSISIQAPNVAASAAEELDRTMDRLFPELIGHAAPEAHVEPLEEDVPRMLAADAAPVPARRSGYIQAIRNEKLLKLARDNEAVFRLDYRPGHYAMEGTPLLVVSPGDRVDETLVEKVNEAYIVGVYRSPTQDVEFAINELVEIAVRSLSPSLNDPFTAVTCVDHLGAALSRLMRRDTPVPFRYDAEGRLRIIAQPQGFPDLVNAAFHQIRQHARRSVAVTVRMLDVLAVLAPQARSREQADAIRHHAVMIYRGGAESFEEEWDRRDLEERYDRVLVGLRKAGFEAGATGEGAS
jgi:uncharacterized membrane protein